MDEILQQVADYRAAEAFMMRPNSEGADDVDLDRTGDSIADEMMPMAPDDPWAEWEAEELGQPLQLSAEDLEWIKNHNG